MGIDLRLGDCLEKLKELPENSVDSIVTDPPYDLVSIVKRFGKPNSAPAQYGKDGAFARVSKGFMGKEWDGTGIAFKVELWQECLRVLKPGGHLIAFGGTRTYHRMAVAIEDAGFEVRDMLEWIYASGFPKSLNVGKAVDKLQGNKREVVGKMSDLNPRYKTPRGGAEGYGNIISSQTDPDRTKGSSIWEGFGTALKPAHEPIILARKPLSEKTIVENVLKHGTGGIDIDGCRIPTEVELGRNNHTNPYGNERTWSVSKTPPQNNVGNAPQGRFPANIICTDDALNDGVTTKSATSRTKRADRKFAPGTGYQGGFAELERDEVFNETSGSKSRYFDIDVWAEKHGLLQFPKASKRERNEGCEGLELKGKVFNGQSSNPSKDVKDVEARFNTQPTANNHPTVKPVHLMSWLIRLVTPPDGVCLDPFMGSGTTGVACRNLGRKFIGIEKEPEYMKIAEARINTTQDMFA